MLVIHLTHALSIREPLIMGKVQYIRPPYTNWIRSAPFYFENERMSTALSFPFQKGFPVFMIQSAFKANMHSIPNLTLTRLKCYFLSVYQRAPWLNSRSEYIPNLPHTSPMMLFNLSLPKGSMVEIKE